MIDRRVLLENLRLIFQSIDRVNTSWRVGERKNEISIRIADERRRQISEFHYQSDVFFTIRVVYIFENPDIDNAIETKRILLLQRLMSELGRLLQAGFQIQDEIRVNTGVVDDNSGFVELEFQIYCKDDNIN